MKKLSWEDQVMSRTAKKFREAKWRWSLRKMWCHPEEVASRLTTRMFSVVQNTSILTEPGPQSGSCYAYLWKFLNIRVILQKGSWEMIIWKLLLWRVLRRTLPRKHLLLLHNSRRLDHIILQGLSPMTYKHMVFNSHKDLHLSQMGEEFFSTLPHWMKLFTTRTDI